MSSSSNTTQETPEQVFNNFKENSKEAIDYVYSQRLLPVEIKCIEVMATVPENAILDEKTLKAYGELHHYLLKQHAFIARMCALPGFTDKDAFTNNSLNMRLWGHGIYDFVSKLDSTHPETNRFIHGYLDRCKSLMEELKGEVPDLTWAWNSIEEQINMTRPASLG